MNLRPLLCFLLACGTKAASAFPDAGVAAGDASQDAATAEDVSTDSTGPTFTDASGTETHLLGKVYAPNGQLPVAGALVYVSTTPPLEIPDEVYCDDCVRVAAGGPYAFSKADGSFDVKVSGLVGSHYLVVKKGAFRRVRPIDIAGGDQQVPRLFTTLPSKTDKGSGDDVPKMLVVHGRHDDIEVSLERLGIEPSAMDIRPIGTNASPGVRNVLSDRDLLMKQHVVFLPCSGSGGASCTNDGITSETPSDGTVQAHLREFVERGGRLYVTDYMYEYIHQTWPGTVKWLGQTPAVGSACRDTSYNAQADVSDPGLKDWLTEVGDTSFELKANWTSIDKVSNPPLPDGGAADSGVKIWMNGTPTTGGGSKRPQTVSFEYGCGRVLFSTYHTETSGSMLAAQEKALLYVLLEVGVCLGEIPR